MKPFLFAKPLLGLCVMFGNTSIFFIIFFFSLEGETLLYFEHTLVPTHIRENIRRTRRFERSKFHLKAGDERQLCAYSLLVVQVVLTEKIKKGYLLVLDPLIEESPRCDRVGNKTDGVAQDNL